MTVLEYLANTYQMSGDAAVLRVEAEEPGKLCVVLDRTIFYPQGGGQPSDTGEIHGPHGSVAVTSVRLMPGGEVAHFCRPLDGQLASGDSVKLSIDHERRLLHARVHSAGHLLDVAVAQLLPHLRASKSYHFPEGPYVEYAGECGDVTGVVSLLQALLDQLIEAEVSIDCSFLDAAQAQSRGIQAPPGKAARFVALRGYEAVGCGCGGTHVRSSADLKGLKIRKISSKKGYTRICYAVEP